MIWCSWWKLKFWPPFCQNRHLKNSFNEQDLSFLIHSIRRLPYRSIFGGVSAMTVEQFESVNGFSNAFFGWGGEDDDMSNRFVSCTFLLSTRQNSIFYYFLMLNLIKVKACRLPHITISNQYSALQNALSSQGKSQSQAVNVCNHSVFSKLSFCLDSNYFFHSYSFLCVK